MLTAETPTSEKEPDIGRSRLYVDKQGISKCVEHAERRPDCPDIDATVTVATDAERVPIL